jgi:hypothetical protein
MSQSRKRKLPPKQVLALPDLEQSSPEQPYIEKWPTILRPCHH